MMKRWSLKVKVGVYAALIIVVALSAGFAVLMPVLYYHQVGQLDDLLKNDAQELFRDLENFRGAPVDPRRPIAARLIPLSLRGRYLVVEGPEGQVIYRSPNLKNATLDGTAGQTRTVVIAGRNCRVGTWREGPYLIRIGTRLGVIEGFQSDLKLALLVSLPVVAIVVFIGGLWLGRRAVAPVAGLTEAAERISAAHPEERLPLPVAKDEIARLTVVLNRSFDRLQSSYESAARFSADASHQLKTPVSILRAGLDHLSRETGMTESQMAEVALLRQQTRRLTALIEDLLLLAQADAGRLAIEVAPIDLKVMAEGAGDDIQTLVTGSGIEVQMDFPETLTAIADRRRIALVLQNLVENAAKYTSPGGSIRIKGAEEGKWSIVRISNTSNPISEADRALIFERFRRGTQVGENVRGHGLGLNIARELVRAHGGDLVLCPAEDGWNTFEFRLPSAVSA